MQPIQCTGTEELDEMEKSIVNKLANEYYQKIARSLKNITSLQIHIKTYEDENKSRKEKQRKFSIHAKAIAPTSIFASTKAHDWDLARTLHKAFKDLENEIEHRLHASDQKPKNYGSKPL